MATQVALVRRRFTVDEYQRMAEAGILNRGDRVELIRGDIVHMTAVGHDHASCVARLAHLLFERLHRRMVLWSQNPVVILPDSEPEPDLILLNWRDDFYRHALPVPADVALLIEVADTSLRYDRHVKGSLYAEAGIRDYWVVDLQGEAIEVYCDPAAAGFQRTARHPRSAMLAPLAFPDVALAVTDILG